MRMGVCCCRSKLALRQEQKHPRTQMMAPEGLVYTPRPCPRDGRTACSCSCCCWTVCRRLSWTCPATCCNSGCMTANARVATSRTAGANRPSASSTPPCSCTNVPSCSVISARRATTRRRCQVRCSVVLSSPSASRCWAGRSPACNARTAPRRTRCARSSKSSAAGISGWRARLRAMLAHTSASRIGRGSPSGRRAAISRRSAPSEVTR